MTVRAVLREKGDAVFSMPPEASLQQVAEELARRRVGAVVVLDGDQLVGILSERDLVRVVARNGQKALDQPATAAMTAAVETCALDDPIDDVLARMTASRFRHMPVMEGSRLIGLVSIGDVVKRRIEEALRERDEVTEYIRSI
jgi:CBS domain-containing protein